MDLRFYNTLTRQKEVFAPIDPANVRMYVCGPTVYDYAHIGNARPAIVFDVLYRLLRHVYGEDHVTYVRNITDVDDKIIDRARRDFPGRDLNEAIREVTTVTTKQYQKDVAALGCLEPTHQPKATDHIGGMIAMTQTLLDKGHAYIAEGKEGREVLFDTTSMPDYGKLSNRSLDEQQAGARIAVEAHKKAPGDFVLWKQSADDAPGWDADFTANGENLTIHGRPGWHLECSVMSEEKLGKIFDIHGGGLDLIFPHHENEIAQSRCAHGNKTMANVWMHNGFLQVEGQKMSKSLGNFVTINELLETDKFGGRNWPGEVLRLAMLMTHYRQPIDFSVKRLEEAEARLDTWYSKFLDAPLPSGGLIESRFLENLGEDLDTSSALMNLGNEFSYLDRGGASVAASVRASADILGILTFDTGTEWFEFKRKLRKGIDVDGAAVDAQIKSRLAFIADKNWAEADRIRDELLEQGIQLKDGKDPDTGERITTWEVKR